MTMISLRFSLRITAKTSSIYRPQILIPSIKIAFLSTDAITMAKREFLTRNRIMKDNIGTSKPSNVIYGIKCTQCDKIYVGETGRNLETRIKEHQQGLMGRRALSKIGEHALYSGHRPDWNDIEIFHRNIKFKKERLFLEGTKSRSTKIPTELKSRPTKIPTEQNPDRTKIPTELKSRQNKIPTDQNPDRPKFRQTKIPTELKSRQNKIPTELKSRPTKIPTELKSRQNKIPTEQNPDRLKSQQNKIPTDKNPDKTKSRQNKIRKTKISTDQNLATEKKKNLNKFSI
ncbi:hypothetical protein LAZ67_1003860 [Cordylochernes scorpioides]|uniref:GIY-YIG domain-containing protein n=1 Tax=Cordylochernes scorpioides TaxID=51811 RepID=A0ABY6JX56_9ARAC|nr:hypothetical protein LAZ67_1003860 [Cordylochernes scorpioides]